MIFSTPHFSLDTNTLVVKTPQEKEVKIFNKDFELLLFLCQKKCAISPGDLLENVWDRNKDYASNLVATSVANIRKQLGKDAIKTVRNKYIVENIEEFELFSENQKRKILFDKHNIFITLFLGCFLIFFSIHQFFFSNPFSINELHINPPGNDNEKLDQEWITLANISNKQKSLNNWTIRDKSNTTYTFRNRTLLAHSSLTLITGICEDSATQVCWNHDDSAIWDNDTDTVFLYDEKGKLVYEYTYQYSITRE